MKNRRRLAIALLLPLALPACSGYQLTGKVVEGTASSVVVVDAGDPRLEEVGLAGAEVGATLDPAEPSRKRLPAVRSGDDGAFALPVKEPGAGLLEYAVQVAGRARGYRSAASDFPLPGRGKRVLVTLAPGSDAGGDAPTSDVLEETLRMGEPYLREQR